MTLMFVNYGSWLEQTFAADLQGWGSGCSGAKRGCSAALGWSSAVIGLAELVGGRRHGPFF